MTRRLRRPLLGASAFFLMACGVGLREANPPNPSASALHSDLSERRRCVKASEAARNPLVAEWPASEKAHLESLIQERVVAVRYEGCDLQVIPGCRLPGNYTWRQTTVATDTLEIKDADELYAKLPIGAIGLEGELARSGHLAVQTTVVGQMRMASPLAVEVPAACHEATHYVEAISIGSFKLFSGSDSSATGRADVGVAGAGGKRSTSRVTLREAGSTAACGYTSSESPTSQCASPIQLFLNPLEAAGDDAAASAGRTRTKDLADPAQTGVYVNFPKAEDSDEVWTLRGRGGEHLCTLPCGAWIQTMGGNFLRRERPLAEVSLPAALPHRPGTEVRAEYQAERGSPGMSKWTFYLLGVPSLVMTGIVSIFGTVELASGCDRDSITGECDDNAGFFLGAAAFYGAIGGASLWWYLYSEEERFETYEQFDSGGPSNLQIGIGPTGIHGVF